MRVFSPAQYQEIDGPDNTYVATFQGLNPGTGVVTTDVATIYGSLTKVIRVVSIGIWGTIATAAATVDISVETRTTLFAGGTSGALAVGSYDPGDQATTVTNNKVFTVPPVTGALGTKLGFQKLFLPLAGALGGVAQWNFGLLAGTKAVYLRGVNSGIAITLNSLNTANAISLDGFIVYTERDS